MKKPLLVKKPLLAGASLGALVLATSSQAADMRLPVKAPPLAPAWTWTGFYVGGTVGAVFETSTVVDDPSARIRQLKGMTTDNFSGVIGGVEAGYNWQISQVVLGVEGDFSWSSLNNTVNPPSFSQTPVTFTSRLNDLGTVRGRVGWAFGQALLYGTGGVAFANLQDKTTNPVIATSSSLTGWVAGGGIEFALSDHWTAKAEFLHVGLPSRVAGTSSATYVFKFGDALDIDRVGINYKF